jgi:hypothetical protein
MLNQLLKDMYNKNIQIELKSNNKLNLIYEQGTLTFELKEKIKQYKQQLIQRLKENAAAKEKGFLLYDFGSFYEYRYGLGAFLFIERHPDGSASSWRANYAVDENKPYKIINLKTNVPFHEAFVEAASFIDWLKKRRRTG